MPSARMLSGPDDNTSLLAVSLHNYGNDPVAINAISLHAWKKRYGGACVPVLGPSVGQEVTFVLHRLPAGEHLVGWTTVAVLPVNVTTSYRL